MKTLKDIQNFDACVDAFMYPTDIATDLIGELCRKGKKVYYAFIDGIYYEHKERFVVAQKIATEVYNK